MYQYLGTYLNNGIPDVLMTSFRCIKIMVHTKIMVCLAASVMVFNKWKINGKVNVSISAQKNKMSSAQSRSCVNEEPKKISVNCKTAFTPMGVYPYSEDSHPYTLVLSP